MTSAHALRLAAWLVWAFGLMLLIIGLVGEREDSNTFTAIGVVVCVAAGGMQVSRAAIGKRNG